MIKARVETEDTIKIKADVKFEKNGASSYNDLTDLPTFNGRPLKGDVVEEDPTVPAWAKQPLKPTYSPEELNVVSAEDSISIEFLASLLD